MALDLRFYKTFGNFSVIPNLNIFCISILENLSQKTRADESWVLGWCGNGRSNGRTVILSCFCRPRYFSDSTSVGLVFCVRGLVLFHKYCCLLLSHWNRIVVKDTTPPPLIDATKTNKLFYLNPTCSCMGNSPPRTKSPEIETIFRLGLAAEEEKKKTKEMRTKQCIIDKQCSASGW